MTELEMMKTADGSEALLAAYKSELVDMAARLADSELRANQIEAQFKAQCKITAAALEERALMVAPSTSKWQPIETAPKDGTTVLLYPPSWTSRTSSTGSWNSDKHARKPAPYWERDDCWNKVMLSRNSPTTHWMPLPAAPIKGGA